MQFFRQLFIDVKQICHFCFPCYVSHNDTLAFFIFTRVFYYGLSFG